MELADKISIPSMAATGDVNLVFSLLNRKERYLMLDLARIRKHSS